MLVEGYIEFLTPFGDPELSGAITASSYPITDAGTIYYSSTSYTGVLFYKYPNQNWALVSQMFEDPGYKRFLWLLDKANDYQQYTPEQLDAMALEKYEVMPLEMNTQYYWSLYNQATPLATPTGLNADNITSDSARISWNAVENASGYKVEYRRQGDTTWNE